MKTSRDASRDGAPEPPVLEARGIVKHFGRVIALDHTDFDLRANEILGVIGDNGAGKSTFIKVPSRRDHSRYGRGARRAAPPPGTASSVARHNH